MIFKKMKNQNKELIKIFKPNNYSRLKIPL